MVRWEETEEERSGQGHESLPQLGSSSVPLFLLLVCTVMSALILS